MSLFTISLIALGINPILGYFLVRESNRNDKLGNCLIWFFAIISSILIVCTLTGISFTSIQLDFIFLSIFYLGICVGIWAILARSNKFFLYVGRLLALFIFGINYLTCSIGILGLGFALQDFEFKNKIDLAENLTYKEYSLGNGLTDSRGTRIEIYKNFTPLPLELKVQEEIIHVIETSGYTHNIDVQYNADKNNLYLYGTDRFVNAEIKSWNDTIQLIK